MTASTRGAEEGGAKGARARRWRRAVVPWVGTAALLAATAYFVDLALVVEHARALDPAWLAAALALSVPMYLLMACRWWFTARRIGAPMAYRHAWLDYYVSSFLNQVLPVALAGDAVRVLRHRARLPAAVDGARLGPAVRAAVLERVSAHVALSLLVVACAVAWMVRGEAGFAPLGLGALGILAALALVAVILGRRRGPVIARLVGDGRAALLSRGAAGVQLGLSLAVVLAHVGMFYCAGRAIGAPLDPFTVLLVVPLVLGATIVPIAFGGWGVREATAAGLYALLGLEPAAGAAVAFSYGVASLLASGPGLLGLLLPARPEPAVEGVPPGAPGSLAALGLGLWLGIAAAASAVAGEPLLFGAAGVVAFAGMVVGERRRPGVGARLGIAGAVTLARVPLTIGLVAALGAVPPLSFVALVFVVFALDGLDGWLARRTGTASTFGASLDQEADAFFVMMLCLLLWTHGLVGAWVLLSGLWRYVYVVLVALAPGRGEAPRSRLGRYAFGVLVVCLAGAFGPWPALATPLAAVGTVVVSMSFGSSLLWSLRSPRRAPR